MLPHNVVSWPSPPRREFHGVACHLQFQHVSESEIARPHCSGILSQQRPALSGARELSQGVWWSPETLWTTVTLVPSFLRCGTSEFGRQCQFWLLRAWPHRLRWVQGLCWTGWWICWQSDRCYFFNRTVEIEQEAYAWPVCTILCSLYPSPRLFDCLRMKRSFKLPTQARRCTVSLPAVRQAGDIASVLDKKKRCWGPRLWNKCIDS